MAGSEAALERMLDALEIPRAGSPGAPKLVINLLLSKGLSNSLNDHWEETGPRDNKRPNKPKNPRVGRHRMKPPFVTDEEECRAERQLDNFMSDIILPLAARTNAIVIVNPFTCNCILTQSFQRTVALHKMKWGRKPPFWVIAMTDDMAHIYGNTNPEAEWRKVRRKCRAWRERQNGIFEAFKRELDYHGTHWDEEKQCWSNFSQVHDFDPNVSMMILSDGVVCENKRSGKWKLDSSAFALLRTELLRFLASSLPSVALQTGRGDVSAHPDMNPGISLVQAKTPLINIDLRERKPVNGATVNSRKELIQSAMDDFDDLRSQLLQRPCLETGRAPLGCKWKEVGRESAEMGTEIKNEALVAVLRDNLQKKVELRKDDLENVEWTSMAPWSHDCYIKVGDKYFKPNDDGPLVDNLIHCNIAWFLDVLKGDGDPGTTKLHCQKREGQDHMPLYRAVQQAKAEAKKMLRDKRSHEFQGDLPVRSALSDVGKKDLPMATQDEIDDVAFRLADRYYQDRFLQDRNSQQYSNSHAEAYPKEIMTLANEIRTLLTSPHFFFLNVHGPLEVAETLVHQIVKLDRLPARNSYEGLQLLQEAWCEYDVTMHLANRYKWVSKLLFALQLALGWAIVFIGTAEKELGEKDIVNTQNWRHVVFGLALGVTLVIAFEALFNSKARWRQLRSAAGSLESLVYLYRTRVGQFELDPRNADSRQPEEELCLALQKWRSDLILSGDLHLSSLQKKHPETIYFHEQTPNARRPRDEIPHQNTTTRDQAHPDGAGSAVGAERRDRKNFKMLLSSESDLEKAIARDDDDDDDLLDDFYSPLPPEKYLDIRIKQRLSFYQRRIPQYARSRYILKAILVLLTTAASAVSAYGLSVWALVIAAAVSMLTSWSEFVDTGRKVERYTKAVVDLKNLTSYWKHLTYFEKASPVTIRDVVMAGESTISDERVAWLSTAQKSPADKEGEGSDQGKGSSIERGKTAKTDSQHTATANKVHPL